MDNSKNQLHKIIRFDWNKAEILKILNMPLIDLMWESQTVHRKFNKYDIQLASLFSVKTGGCEEIVRTVANQFIVLAKSKVIHSFKLKKF